MLSPAITSGLTGEKMGVLVTFVNFFVLIFDGSGGSSVDFSINIVILFSPPPPGSFLLSLPLSPFQIFRRAIKFEERQVTLNSENVVSSNSTLCLSVSPSSLLSLLLSLPILNVLSFFLHVSSLSFFFPFLLLLLTSFLPSPYPLPSPCVFLLTPYSTS